ADRNRSHWSTSKTPSYTKSVSWQHHRRSAAFHQDFRKIRNHASEFTDLIILILIYFEKGIGIYAVFLKILIIGMDFRARKGFYMDTLLIISSSHHQQFTSLFRV
ncbi:hypothetical protein, partial [Escherichia coli]|uniref:hypothetical protein n=20 Tax=Escherichia coli TaxID=562 RepID=UPI0038BD25A6